MDFPRNARKFLHKIQPDFIVIVKYEFWINHLKEAFWRNIPVIYLSAIFKKDQVYFNRGSGLYIPVFRNIEHFFVQNTSSMEILQQHKINQVTVSGDTRFDRVHQIASSSKKLELIEKFLGNRDCIVVGSAWNSDLDIIAPFLKEISGHLKIIIAPHNIDEENILEMEKEFPDSIRYTDFNGDENIPVLIVNNMGMLSSLYRYAKYAIIGGAFKGTLHNTLEAAVYGIPLFFGNHENNRKFEEALNLLRLGGAFTFSTSDELKKRLGELEDHPEKYQKAASVSKKFVAENTGATEIVLNYLQKYLP